MSQKKYKWRGVSPKGFGFLGFTLVELLVVIAILAILGTTGFLSIGNYLSSARDSARVSDIANISSWLELIGIERWAFPIPLNGRTSSGWSTTIVQWTIDSSILPRLSANMKDTLTGKGYGYSVLGNWSHYQVMSELENPLASNLPLVWIETAFAATSKKVAALRWNYIFDPSLPSLFISTWSQNNIFDPNNCFVLNKSANILSDAAGCTPKKDMTFKEQDPNLIWYWDMETYYQWSYSWSSNVVFLKDLSGNKFDMAGDFRGNPLTWTSTASWSIFDSSYIKKWVKFDKGSFQMMFSTPLASRLPNSQGASPVTRGVFTSGNAWSGINPWFTFVSFVNYDASLWMWWNNKRIVTWWQENTSNVGPWDALKLMDIWPLRFSWTRLHSFFAPYNDLTAWVSYGTWWLAGCWNNDWLLTGADFCGNAFFQTSSDDWSNGWKMVLASVINFTDKSMCQFKNGVQLKCVRIERELIDRILESGYSASAFAISNTVEPFAWTIYEQAIYNVALTPGQIKQHARIMGF